MIVRFGGLELGGPRVLVIAGPCAVESEERILEAAELAKEAGADALRAGAFKPRTKPSSFQGLGRRGLEHLRCAADRVGLPVVTECMSEDDVELVAELADVVQVGARNCQNFALLKKLARISRPVLLKRGFAQTIEEWQGSADYVLTGNANVALCERGIRSFDKETRNVLDVVAVAAAKARRALPVAVDPSHATGRPDLVLPAALAGVAAGADAVLVEFHPRPREALSDAEQALDPAQLGVLVRGIRAVAMAVGRL